ncbi:UNVERIFIED_CONTAM: hypothetical protein HDU68_008541, partial [Siphonaria sp. JEL0065]
MDSGLITKTHTPESLQATLILSAQIGQQLLNKTKELEQQLHEEKLKNETLQEQIEDQQYTIITLENRLQGHGNANLLKGVLAKSANTASRDLVSLDDGVRDDDEQQLQPEANIQEFDAASNDMLNFIEQGKTHSAYIEKEILSADDQLIKFSRKLSILSSKSDFDRFSQPPSSRYVSIENMQSLSLHRPAPLFATPNEEKNSAYEQAEELANWKLQLEAGISSVSTDSRLDSKSSTTKRHIQNEESDRRQSVIYDQVLKDENIRLQTELASKGAKLLEQQIQIDNVQDQLDRSKIQLEELRASSMTAVVSDLETQLKESISKQNELSKSLVTTKESLMKETSKLAEKDIEILKKSEELIQAKLDLTRSGISKPLQELAAALKENDKLVKGNLDLGAQLSKLTTDFANNLWDLRSVSSERDKLRLRVTDLEVQTRELKTKALEHEGSRPTRHWGTQTTEDDSQSAQEQKIAVNSMELEMKAQQKLIEILKMDLDEARQSSVDTSTDTIELRTQLSGLRKEREELTSSVEQFLSGSNDFKGDDNSGKIKVALYEARKLNAELIEKLKASEKSVAGQKETIFNIGSQLAQQSMKLGDIEWKLRQKEEEKNAASQRILALEAEKDKIVQKLEEASKELSQLSSEAGAVSRKGTKTSNTKDKLQGESVIERVESLEAQKNKANQKILVAVKEIENIDKDIYSLNRRSNRAEISIAESAKLLGEKSKQSQMDVEQLSSLSAMNVELLEEIQELKSTLNSLENGEILELQQTIESLREELEAAKAVPPLNTPTIQMDGASPEDVIFDTKCNNCMHLTERLNVAMSRLEIELGKAKSAHQSRLSAEKEKSALSEQIIELQKKLNTAVDETEFVKVQTEIRLKSYNEMKKLIIVDQEMSVKPVALGHEENYTESIPIVVESSMNGSGNISGFGTMESATQKTFPAKDSEQYTSTDLLVGHLSRSSNIQLQLESVTREKVSLQEQLRKAELKALMAEDEAKELRAVDQRNAGFLSTQIQERTELSDKLSQLQNEIAEHIIAKSALEAELLAYKQPPPEKKRLSLFKTGKKNEKSPSIGGPKSRANSNERGGDLSPTSPTNEVAIIENKIIAERDKLASELVTKSKENAKLTKEIGDLNSQLAKAKQDIRESMEKTAVLVRDNEEAINVLTLSHAEMEECYQNQIQELVDQLMEPKPYAEEKAENANAGGLQMTLEQQAMTIRTEKSKSRQLTLSLKESQTQVDTLKFKVEKLESEFSQLVIQKEVESFVNQHIIDFAQVALEKYGELSTLQNTIAKLKAQNEMLKTRSKSFSAKQQNVHTTEDLKEVVALKKKITLLTAEIEKRNSDESLESAKASYLDIIKKLEDEVTYLHEEITHIIVSKETLQKQTVVLEGKALESLNLLTVKTAAHDILVEEQTQLTNRLETTMAKLREVQEKCAAAESKVSVLDAQNTRNSEIRLNSKECEGCLQLGNSLKRLNSELVDWQSRQDKTTINLSNSESQRLTLEAKVKSLESEISHMKKIKEEVDSSASDLRNQIAEMKQRHRSELMEASSSKTNANELIETLENNLKEAERTARHAVEAYNDLKSSNSNGIHHAKSRQDSNEVKSREIEALNEKVEILEQALKTAKDELDLYVHQVSAATRASETEKSAYFHGLLEKIQSKLETQENLVSEYMEANSLLKAQAIELNFKIAELEESQHGQNHPLKTKSDVDGAKEKTKDQIRESVAKTSKLKAQVAELESIVSQLETKNEQLSFELSIMRSQQQQLQQQQEADSNAHDPDLKNELDAVKLQLSEQTKIATLRQANLDTKEEKMEALQVELDSLHIDVESLKAENFTISNQLEKAKARIDELIKLSIVRTTKLKGKEEWIAELEIEVSRLRVELQQAKSVSSTATDKSKASSSKESEKDPTSKRNNPAAELEKAKSKIDELINMSIGRTTALQEKDEKIEELEIEVTSLRTQLEVANTACTEIDNLHTQIKTGKQKILEMTKDSILQSTCLKEKDVRIEELESEITLLKVSVPEGELELAQTQLKNAKAKAEEAAKSINELSGQLKERDETISELDDNISELEEQLKELRLYGDKATNAELVKLKARLESTSTQLKASEATVKQLEEQVIDLKEKMTIHEEKALSSQGGTNGEISRLQSQIEKLKQKLEETARISNEHSVELTEKKLEISELHDRVSELEEQEKMTHLTGDAAANSERVKLRAKLDAKTSQLKNAEHSVQELETLVMKLKETIDAKQEEVSDVKRLLHDAKGNLAKKEAEMAMAPMKEEAQIRQRTSTLAISTQQNPQASAASSPSTAVDATSFQTKDCKLDSLSGGTRTIQIGFYDFLCR